MWLGILLIAFLVIGILYQFMNESNLIDTFQDENKADRILEDHKKETDDDRTN